MTQSRRSHYNTATLFTFISTHRWLHQLLLLALLILCLPSTTLQVVSATSLILTVPAGEEDCYMVRAPYHSTINMNYNTMEEHLSAKQIVVIFTDASGKVLYRSKYGKDHGSFQMNLVENVKFQVCVQNALTKKFSHYDNLPRSVGISIRVDPPPAEVYDEKTQNLMDYSSKVFTAVSDLAGHFEFRKFREAKHRQIVELIFSELLWWTLAQAICVISVALAQVFYLRRTVSRTVY